MGGIFRIRFLPFSNPILNIGSVLLVVGSGLFVFQLSRSNYHSETAGSVIRVAAGQVIRVAAGQDLQSAINKAKPGDTLVLDAGAVYKVSLELPRKPGSSYITIQSSRIAEMIEGARVGPPQSDLFAKLQSATPGEPVIKTLPGSHHYRFLGIEISTATSIPTVSDLVRIGDGRQTSSEVP